MKRSTKILSLSIVALVAAAAIFGASLWRTGAEAPAANSAQENTPNVELAGASDEAPNAPEPDDTANTESAESDGDEASDASEGDAAAVDEGARATLLVAGGCFWCVEADLEKLRGVGEVVSGYAEGTNEDPTYEDYSDFGHREVVEAEYNPTVVSFEEIIIYALKHMDPTDPDGSFGDRGEQYAPALYYETPEQKQEIENVITRMDDLDVYDDPLAVEVMPRPEFWEAEDYHQNYYKGTLSSVKYSYYRNASGRDDFIEESWGDDTGPSLPR